MERSIRDTFYSRLHPLHQLKIINVRPQIKRWLNIAANCCVTSAPLVPE